MQTIKSTCIAFVFLVSLSQCAKKNSDVLQPDIPKPSPEQTTLNRGALLENVASNIIIPSYSNFKVTLDSLSLAEGDFTSTPDSVHLVALRLAFEKAYIAWQKVELFDVGPATTHRLRNHFNIYPANTAAIQANWANASTADLNSPNNYSAQGFPCLDFLLFGQGTFAETLTKYTTDAQAANHLAYLKAVVNKMQSLLGTVYSEWTGGYKSMFVSNTSLEIGSPMSDLVNGYVMNYERYLRTGKFGLPSGIMVDGGSSSRPDLVEAYYNREISLSLAKTALQASVDFFNGKSVVDSAEGYSLKTYLNELGAKDSKTSIQLSEAINTQFTDSKIKMNNISNNLVNEVQNNNSAMIATFNSLQTTVRMLKVDMTSAMSILVSYSDNDGD